MLRTLETSSGSDSIGDRECRSRLQQSLFFASTRFGHDVATSALG
jgi:hypothetical protein